MKPGIYSDISNEAYHSGPGVSKSQLDLLRQSPAHLQEVIKARENDSRPDTKAYFVGREFHMLVLEPEIFKREYVQAFGRDQAPETIDDREVLVQMVESINAERIAAHPGAVRDTETLVDKINELNADRKPKLSQSGGKKDMVLRIMEALDAGDDTTNPERFEALMTNGAAELKEAIADLNKERTGLLPARGSRSDLAGVLRENGVEVVLWSEIIDDYQQEHGRPYILSTSAASRHDMAAWLTANGKPVLLWSDVKAKWDAENGERVILNPDQWEQIHAMRDSVMAHPLARKILSLPGKAEQSIYWTDKRTGELCRIRPDWKSDNHKYTADLKTTEDASEEGFKKSIEKFRYDIQDAFYTEGIEEVTGVRTIFCFIAVEKKPPYAVAVHVVDDLYKTIGKGQFMEDLYKLHECNVYGKWPAYSDEAQELSPNGYFISRNIKFIEQQEQ